MPKKTINPYSKQLSLFGEEKKEIKEQKKLEISKQISKEEKIKKKVNSILTQLKYWANVTEKNKQIYNVLKLLIKYLDIEHKSYEKYRNAVSLSEIETTMIDTICSHLFQIEENRNFIEKILNQIIESNEAPEDLKPLAKNLKEKIERLKNRNK